MEWVVKTFNELDAEELYKILQLRVDVFVVEQRCAYPELDGYDFRSIHYYLKDGEEIAAYARLLPAGSMYEEASIGRVLVAAKYRGNGYGRQLLANVLHYMKNEQVYTLKIQAQQYLKKFYESFQFRQISEPYLDDGIWHIDMTWVNDHN
ncbi:MULTISPECIES: GNAT family N-acetyltransferase [Virgibacillus]|uniref:GNAT family acetyltransferase n=2 Tax=Virgibacillus TaxID=84406 RepID=A0ABQ2DP53_9BACI|nr:MULTISPECIES: GNAT family N-acetyltransferase [Virgibacillus]EQB38832.1 hypothetical protein M948_00380 [Virgibacillus sp. CM-4]MYL43815.1 GNAT family N-acetyltransferase [Virgibacillus massiliensis]GGJ66382.1 GNAT family acetyltransferase [Virgibacillus kapii]CDQ40957.1 putative acyltransferase [Virgibacillus massiliensis]